MSGLMPKHVPIYKELLAFYRDKKIDEFIDGLTQMQVYYKEDVR